MSSRLLQAYINTRRVGELSGEGGIWSFSYDPGWVAAADGYALSPALPLGTTPIVDTGSMRPVQWYFDNLLPEETARTLLAKDAKLSAADAFGLLAYYGAESAGSLTLLPGPPEPAAEALRPLDDSALRARIAELPRVSLAAHAVKRMSLAGAQHKLAVVLRDGQLFEPVGQTPSTFILKPDNKDGDYPHTVVNEYFTMSLAGALNLPAPAVFRRYVPSPVYLIERFDRAAAVSGTGVDRRHLIDACQVLNLDRQFKYAEGAVERLAELANQCTAPATARLRLFAWLVFNLLTGNGDAHLKNLSFLVTRRGIELSPCYDLLSVAVYETRTFGRDIWPRSQLAWPLLGKTSFDSLTRADVLAAAATLGLSREVAIRLLDAQVGRIEAAAQRLVHDIERENAEMVARQPTLAATFAGELRCLRAITNIIVRDMAAQLR